MELHDDVLDRMLKFSVEPRLEDSIFSIFLNRKTKKELQFGENNGTFPRNKITVIRKTYDITIAKSPNASNAIFYLLWQKIKT